jgi:hypothetical protein
VEERARQRCGYGRQWSGADSSSTSSARFSANEEGETRGGDQEEFSSRVGKPAGMASCVVAAARARVDGTARRVARGGSAVDHGRGSMAYVNSDPPRLAGPQQGTRGVRTPEQCVDDEWRAWLQRPHRESASAGVACPFLFDLHLFNRFKLEIF